MLSVNGTPRFPEDHAKQIVRRVDRCPHNGGKDVAMATRIGKTTHNDSGAETFRFTLILAGRSRSLRNLKRSSRWQAAPILSLNAMALLFDFDRVADSLQHAIVTAIHEVEVKAGIGLRVARVEPPEVIREINLLLELRRSSKSIPTSVRNDALESFRSRSIFYLSEFLATTRSGSSSGSCAPDVTTCKMGQRRPAIKQGAIVGRRLLPGIFAERPLSEG